MDLFGIKRRDKKLHEYIKNGIASIMAPKEINKDMKEKINDLLLKMQTGENCIGETANALLNLNNVIKRELLLDFLNVTSPGMSIDDKNAIINNYLRLKYYNFE